MRSLVFLLAISACLVSCQGRHIDYSVGAGPQGGPGYKTTPPDHEGVFHEATVQIWPDRTRQPDRTWPFVIAVSCDDAMTEWQYFADPITQKVYNSRYPEWASGQVSCADGASAQTCKQIVVTMSPETFSSSGCKADISGLVFSETIKKDCMLSGRLQGEAKRVWATGGFTQLGLISQGNADVFLSGGLAELETAADLAPKNLKPMALDAKIDDDHGFAVQFRFPTRTADGAVITPASYQDTLKVDARGHYVGTLTYEKFDEELIQKAEIDFACR